MIFETHAHYDDEKFDGDRVELLSHLLKENNIGNIVNVGASFRGCKDSLKLAESYDNVYAAIGIHPEEIDEASDGVLEWLRENASNPKVVAIGEIGLDYYWVKDPEGRAKQHIWFDKQMDLAKEVNLPVVIHSREAAEDTFNTIKSYNTQDVKGIVHCYSYSKELALEYVKMGWYIGVGGVVTFKNGKKLVETVEAIPLENIVLETDCPYMAPEPHRGSRNSSIYLKYVAEKIAQLKGVSVEEVERITYENALRIYSKCKRN
ncbi:TatD DNase family protein [Pseudobutyrivibrio sp. NOR37]|uniref:TatD family deoxyribonuclease n=1 Tax=Pseudobutyrivibrio xylanivorans TaxID=185007 RepID=A0A6M0LHN8_PSEXY|nr:MULTISPECIES: TatD family hydrolase [Pseudobutyrivibrio]NEX02088.1 TatD family deoxyribonuclease [Pseudobutyrivibrio xylanivorans]SFR74263.1 TatD DNase family protein [Pseudobutyrivibrio sp. NOR37]